MKSSAPHWTHGSLTSAVIVILVKAQRAVALELEPPEGCAAGRQERRLWALLGSCFPPSKMGSHTFLMGQGWVSQVGSYTVLRRVPDQSVPDRASHCPYHH